MGGFFFFYTLRGPAFSGAFAHVMRLSWEPFRWKTNKVRPVAEAWLFLVCVLPTAGHQALGGRGWLPLPWRTESGQGGGSWGRERPPLGHLFGEVWSVDRMLERRGWGSMPGMWAWSSDSWRAGGWEREVDTMF